MIALEAQAHSILEWPKCKSHRLSLILDSSIGFRSLSSKSRKCLSLESAAWKIILH